MRLAAVILLFVLLFPPACFAGGSRPSVTVMPFVAQNGNGEAWLGKALSDLVARKLADGGGFDVLERDKLQAFIKEIELQQSGFTDPDMLARIGSLARVESVIYGTYAVDNDKIALGLVEMNTATRKILYRATAEGGADNLPDATAALVIEYLRQRGQPPEDTEIGNISYRATDSMPTYRHFYEGLDLYDKGRYEDAYAEFLLAQKQDDKYYEARLWAARMMEYTGNTAQAIVSYKTLYEAAPLHVEGRDALLFSARLQENSAPAEAAASYRILAELRPRIPEGVEAAYRLGIVLEKQGKYADAYRALQSVQEFREEADDLMERLNARELVQERRDFFDIVHELRRIFGAGGAKDENARLAQIIDLQMRQSRFFDWNGALSLYRGTVLEMVSIFRKAQKEDASLKPPRGAFAVDAENPVIGDAHYGDTKSLFFKDTSIHPQWDERFYAAIVPDGYTATGVTLSITGRVPQPTTTTDFTLRVFGFPMMRNYFNNWLGVIYGQTQAMTTLRKEIPFYGRNRDILMFQLIENRSEIGNWKVEFRLEKVTGEETAQPVTATAGEGVEVARLPLHEDIAAGASDPQYIEQYGNKKRLAIAMQGSGEGWLVAAKGSIAAGDTDLWGAQASDGKWGDLAPLPLNGQSNDFAPQLVKGEDGSVRLFWISDRRGLGWEIWTSALAKNANDWSQPVRLPLDKLSSQPQQAGRGETPLDFAAMQDKSGRWLVAAATSEGLTLLSSTDGIAWNKAGIAGAGSRLYNPVFYQDATATYWLGALDGGANFRLMKSFDLAKWDEKSYALGSYSRHWSDGGNSNYGSVVQIAGYPMYLGDSGDGSLTLLFSDTVTGLQYARFRPDTQQPSPDLVRNITLQPYAAAQLPDGKWLAASWEGDAVVLRRYQKFAFADNPENSASDPLYQETEFDKNGNRWDRRIARTRYVLPDVTAVGVEKDGRAWWGIETGVMSLKGADFYVSDVSMGFFHHDVSNIMPCGDKVYFAADTLDTPEIGVMANGWFSRKTDKLAYPELDAAITAIGCGKNGEVLLGTSKGDVATASGTEIGLRQHVSEAKVTAVALRGDDICAGDAAGGVHIASQSGVKEAGFKGTGFAINGISVASNDVWVSTAGGGLYRHDDKWTQYTPANSSFPYASPGKIRAVAGGVWAMPDAYTRSQGMVFFDGKEAKLFDPPSHNIYDIVDFDVAPDGAVWVGSASSGIYRLERGKK